MKPSKDTIRIIVGLVLLAGVAAVVYFTGGFERSSRTPSYYTPPQSSQKSEATPERIRTGKPFKLAEYYKNLPATPTRIQFDNREEFSTGTSAVVSARILIAGQTIPLEKFRDYYWMTNPPWFASFGNLLHNGPNSFSLASTLADGTTVWQDFTITLGGPPEDLREETLTIAWLPKPVEYDFQSFAGKDLPKDTVDSDPEVLRTGTVRGGTYDGYGLYLFDSGFCNNEMMGCAGDTEMQRVLKSDTGKGIYLLPAYSKPLLSQEVSLFDKQLPNVTIPSLYRPDEFNQNGVTLKKKPIGWSGVTESWFVETHVSIASHPIYGTIYTSASTSTPYHYLSSNAFFIKLPDGRAVSYVFDPPFIPDQHIPRITWNDGTENQSDYTWTDRGGCGATNEYAVRSESILRPAERLVVSGRTATGDPVYLFKDNNDIEIKDEYISAMQYVGPDEERMSYYEFVRRHPIFYWKDPFNRWIRFVRIDALPAAECGKPVIYLYTEKEMDARVFVGLKGLMTKSEPTHGSTGWSVVARPDGFVVNKSDGKTYPNLYWEGFGVNYETPKQGFVVEGAKVDAWLAATLRQIGFTERENAEFREFWTPRLPSTGLVFITFVPQFYFDRDAPLRITPKPDAVTRIFMEWKPLSAPLAVEPLLLPKIIRRGFTVVEWGGALH